MVIEDALQDVRFAGNPLVAGPPGIRFYAGAPLVSSANGYRYGSLCIIDLQPHKDFTLDQYNLLAQFAELAVREIEKDKLALLQKMVRDQPQNPTFSIGSGSGGSPMESLRSSVSELDPANWGLSRAADCFVEGVMLVDVGIKAWHVLYTNAAFSNVLGVPKDEATSQGFWDLFGGPGLGPDACAASVEANEPFSITVTLQSIYRQTPKVVTIDFRPTATAQLGLVGVPTGIGGIGERFSASPNPHQQAILLQSSGSFGSNGNGNGGGTSNGSSSVDGNGGGGGATTSSAAAASAIATNDTKNGNGTTSNNNNPIPIQPRKLFFAIVQPDMLRPGAIRPVSDGARRFGIIAQPGASTLTHSLSAGSNRDRNDANVPSINKATATAFTDVRLGPLIGRGAYGRVYRGSWNGNTVAVKVMETSERVALPDDPHGRPPVDNERHGEGARGIFEAVLSSALSHPNVVHTYQYAVRPISRSSPAGSAVGSAMRRGSMDGNAGRPRQLSEVWLISEFCNRGPLLTAIERGAFLTQPSAQYGQPNLIAVLHTLQEIAAAMHYLHSHGILHGDLTGGNVLLTSSDKDARGFTAKVVDFGLSRVCGDDGYLHTKTMGCAEYMPPELITGGMLTKAGDVYAFGIITWELYVGRRAWEGLQPGQVLKKVAKHEMLEFPPQTPHRLKVLGERCMAADQGKRPTFAEVLNEVNAILSDTLSILQQFLHATAANRGGEMPGVGLGMVKPGPL